MEGNVKIKGALHLYDSGEFYTGFPGFLYDYGITLKYYTSDRIRSEEYMEGDTRISCKDFLEKYRGRGVGVEQGVCFHVERLKD